MTIRKGEPWGEPAVCPTELRVVPTDRDLRDWVVWHRTRGRPIGDVGVSGGDLARTCGGGTAAHPGAAKVTVDVMRVVLDDGEPTWSVAHAVARREWWRGEIVMVMNAQYFGAHDVAPRSHPNDGKVDVVRIDPAMSARDRLAARRRARSGMHLGHPQISVRAVSDLDVHFDRPMVVWIDGVRAGTARHLAVVVEPDALTAYV